MDIDDEITDDAFLGGRLQILQPKKGYRAGVDAVLLGASVPLPKGASASVLDVGAGVGTAGLCVLARCPSVRVAFLEREADLVALLRENASRNGGSGRNQIIHGDVDGISNDALEAAGAPEGSFDHVIANPPFHVEGDGTSAGHRLKALSHAAPKEALDGWCRFMARMAKPSGTATMIHKADALGDILAGFRGRFGAIKVLPIHPRDGAAAIRVIVRGIKGSKAPMELLAGAVLHEDGHGFTPGAADLLRLGAGLDLDYWTGLRRTT